MDVSHLTIDMLKFWRSQVHSGTRNLLTGMASVCAADRHLGTRSVYHSVLLFSRNMSTNEWICLPLMISAQREHFVHKSKKVEHFGRTVLSTKICAKCQCAPKLEKREHRSGYEMRGNDTNRLTYVFQVLQWLTDLRDICLLSFLPRVILHSWNRCTAYPCRWFVFHLRTPWMENWRTGWWLKWLNAIWWWAFQFIQFIWATKRLLTLMPPERAENSMSDEQKIRAISKSH